MGGLGADLNGAAEDWKSQLHDEECIYGELGFGRKGGEAGFREREVLARG